MPVRTRKVKPRYNLETVCGKEYKMYPSRFIDGRSAIHVSDHMTGKMLNVPSISTSCLDNPFCKARLENGIGICAHCFAETTLKMRPTVRRNMTDNFNLLTGEVLPEEVLPQFKPETEIVRLESFGDVYNETQCVNYLHIVRKNPHAFFSVWTKNPKVWEHALAKTPKPQNLNIVISSQEINCQTEKVPDFADVVFTVYTKDKPESEINCGARSCDACRACYRKYQELKIVNEHLK